MITYISWAWNFYLRKQSLLYKYKRIMLSHFCSEWSFWSFLSKMSKMSIMLIMLTVITFNSSNQNNHFKTLITQWLFNHCLLYNFMQESFNIKFFFKIFVLKITFSSCFFIAQSKTLSYVTKIFLNVQILSVLSYVLVNTVITCKRNAVLTMKLIIVLSVCILIVNAISLSQWWSKKE